jgi:phosphatidylserine decarboxylase
LRIPIASDGWRFIIPLLLLGGLLIWHRGTYTWPLGVVLVAAGLFCVNFFRDFNRDTPPDPALVYSPADGTVVSVDTVPDGAYKGQPIIRIFLNVFDVHVQRSPVAGSITKVEYKKGKFLDARHENAHLENEQNLVTIATPKGGLVVNQIAGLIARRIVCWKREGDSLTQGERYGLIRFGSQVDVVFPANSADMTVKVGERVVGGKTVIARWKA